MACGTARVPPAPPAAPVLRVAVPTEGVYAQTNMLIHEAVERALPSVAGGRRGGFQLEMMPVPQPTAEPLRSLVSQVTTLGPLLRADTPPDLLVLTSFPSAAAPPGELAAAAEMHWLQPLDDYLKRDRTLALGEFFPAALDQCRDKGRLMGIPLMAVPLLLVYDTQRFSQAGVASPTGDWSWLRFLRAAYHLTRDIDGDGTPDEYGFCPGLPSTVGGTLLTFIWQNSGEIVSADRKRALLTERAALEAIEFFASLYRPTAVSPPLSYTHVRLGPVGIRYGDRWPCAMLYHTDWHFPPPLPLAAAELPQGRQRATALAVPATLSISGKAKDPALAAAALAALAEHISKDISPPARRLPAATLQRLQPRLTPAMAQMLVNVLDYSRSLMLGDTRLTRQVLDVLNKLASSLQYGTPAPAQAAQFANHSLQQWLDQASY